MFSLDFTVEILCINIKEGYEFGESMVHELSNTLLDIIYVWKHCEDSIALPCTVINNTFEYLLPKSDIGSVWYKIRHIFRSYFFP